jgi:hypothetical protein
MKHVGTKVWSNTHECTRLITAFRQRSRTLQRVDKSLREAIDSQLVGMFMLNDVLRTVWDGSGHQTEDPALCEVKSGEQFEMRHK